jgi:Zn-dependent protease with chaperone function
MAGVLGHELSHAINRDTLTLLARRVGMAALIAAVSGGHGGTILVKAVQTTINLQHSREAEDKADSFSVRLLARSGIPPDSFGDALKLIRVSHTEEHGLLKYLDLHSSFEQWIFRARDLARQQFFTLKPLGVDWVKIVHALSQ